jgi:hypothetical protein
MGKLQIVKRLREAAVKAGARVSAAKGELKSAKSQLKRARKLFKSEKKAAKQLRRKLQAAVAATFVRPPKPAVPKVKASVAKTPKSAPSRKTVAGKKPAARTSTAAKPKPRRTLKPSEKPAPDTMRSAAEVAKSVIERLHAPPPLLPPTPLIPPTADAGDASDSTGPGTAKP